MSYTTEQARMRLREAMETHEWPEDGTSLEHFIRAVFPDDGEPEVNWHPLHHHSDPFLAECCSCPNCVRDRGELPPRPSSDRLDTLPGGIG